MKCAESARDGPGIGRAGVGVSQNSQRANSIVLDNHIRGISPARHTPRDGYTPGRPDPFQVPRQSNFQFPVVSTSTVSLTTTIRSLILPLPLSPSLTLALLIASIHPPFHQHHHLHLQLRCCRCWPFADRLSLSFFFSGHPRYGLSAFPLTLLPTARVFSPAQLRARSTRIIPSLNLFDPSPERTTHKDPLSIYNPLNSSPNPRIFDIHSQSLMSVAA
jgi:hypothetical protein